MPQRSSSSVLAALLAAAALLAGAELRAATLTVTSTGDADVLGGGVTLREAIAAVNAQADHNDAVNGSANPYGTNDTIAFALGAGGPHVILVGALPLPNITKPVLIDGYTQAGSSPNTLAVGDDRVLQVILRGTTSGIHGLSVFGGGDGTTIRGLVLQKHFFAVHIQANDVTVAGCFIGTDATGTTADAATFNNLGVNVSSGNLGGNVIGGPLPADRNVIAGNGAGIIMNSQLPNSVRGNYIGVDKTGSVALGHIGVGIAIGTLGSPGIAGATIGGNTSVPGRPPGNVISGNGAVGIQLHTGGGTSSIGAVTIAGNILGLDATGATALPNTGANVSIRDVELPPSGIARLGPVTIGGSSPGDGNVLSAGGHGVFSVAVGTVIRGNKIGTDVTGTVARPNTFGIEITGTNAFAGSATIGGSGAAEGNLIAGNSSDAVRIFLASATIQGNRIGTTPAGAALGNGGYGIFVDSGETVIGGTAPGAGNVIANSGDHGVNVRIGSAVAHNASNASLLGNSIYANALLGINNSAPDVVTANDPGDGDSGPNDLQNFPVITSATLAGGNVTVAGTLNSTALGSFRVELFANTACDSFGHGEGRTYLGFTTVNTDAAGNGSFGPLALAIPGGQPVITATATNPAGHTSELSACLTATAAPPPAPSGLGATSARNGVALAWADNSADETSFRVERALAGPSPSFAQVATTAANATSHLDGTAVCNTDYLYRVRAHRSGDNVFSAYSSVAAVTHVCPDLTVAKSTSRDVVFTGQSWTWTLAVENGGSGPASFLAGETVLGDVLPVGVTYGAVTATPGAGVTGTLACAEAAGTLACTATTPVGIPAGAGFTVGIVATAGAAMTVANGGSDCAVDPAAALVETVEANNACNISQVTIDDGLLVEGFEDGLPGRWAGVWP